MIPKLQLKKYFCEVFNCTLNSFNTTNLTQKITDQCIESFLTKQSSCEAGSFRNNVTIVYLSLLKQMQGLVDSIDKGEIKEERNSVTTALFAATLIGIVFFIIKTAQQIKTNHHPIIHPATAKKRQLP